MCTQVPEPRAAGLMNVHNQFWMQQAYGGKIIPSGFEMSLACKLLNKYLDLFTYSNIIYNV